MNLFHGTIFSIIVVINLTTPARSQNATIIPSTITAYRVEYSKLKISPSNGAEKQSFPERPTTPVVGKPMPDFVLENVTNYQLSNVSLKDFNGKWLFLDFWFPGCVTCIRSFPKVNEFQKKFKNDIVYMMVGLNFARYYGIEALYEELRKKNNLEMAAAYDSTLATKWKVHAMPDIFIIDPNGVLKYRTGGLDMTLEKIERLIRGESPYFRPKDKKEIQIGIDNKNPTEFDSTILYQSILTEFNENNITMNPIDYQLETPIYKRRGFKATGIPLAFLYNIAYIGKAAFSLGGPDSLYGKVYPVPIVIRKNGSILILDKYNELGELGKKYNYSLDVPENKATKEGLMNEMQQDLKRYFGFDVKIEKRQMSVWVLKSLPNTGNRLKTQTKEYYQLDTNKTGLTIGAGFSIKNVSMIDFIRLFSIHLEEVDQIPLIDETGIKNNIDISMFATMTNLSQVKKELNRNGFELDKSTRFMSVIVLQKK